MRSSRNFVGVGRLWRLLLFLVIGWLPALSASETIAKTSQLFGLSYSSSPYFQPEEAGLLYVITPLVVVSAFLLFLSPGGILVLTFGRVEGAAEWIALSFGASIPLVAVLGTVTKLVTRYALTWTILGPLWLTATFVAWLMLAYRVRQGVQVSWPIADNTDHRRIFSVGLAIAIGVIAFLPKLFWENFNLDGIEAFEFGRSLTANLLPHWELQDGIFGFYQNFVLFAYPNHWFMSLFGPVEAAARLPFLLYLVVLLCTTLLLVEHKQNRKAQPKEELILGFGLASFALVQAYNTNYEPFFADIAEMAATDTLWITCFTLACYALWRDRRFMFGLFAIMTYSASPGGLLLIAALLPATFVAKPEQWRSQARLVVAALGLCVTIGVAYTIWYKPVFLGAVNDQFSAFNMLRRLYPPTLAELVRLNALLFPSGILPALSLAAVRRKEPFSLVVAMVTLAYFLVVYSQAWTSLHQFTPAMVLPLVVFWRLFLTSSKTVTSWVLPSLAITTLLSMFLSLPRHFQVNQATREFGQSTSFEVGNYDLNYQRSAEASRSLYALLPEEYRLQYPEQPWGADALSWLHYATREKPPGQMINYVIRESSAPAPMDATEIASKDGVSVYVNDLEAWKRDRERELPQVVISPLYEPILRRTYQFFRDYSQAERDRMRE